MPEYDTMTWTIGVVLLTLAVGVAVVMRDQIRLRKRKGLSKAEFCAAFHKEAVPESLVGAVYDYYSSFALGRQVAISPDDSFESLQVGQDDVDDDLNRLLKKLALERPSSVKLAELTEPVRTIGDIVRWLNWVRQHQ
jgi:hypothetical protein